LILILLQFSARGGFFLHASGNFAQQLVSGSDQRARLAEHPSHLGFEAFERIDVEIGIEGGRVPFVDQFLGEGEPTLVPEALAPLRILAEMLEIIAALEFLVPVDGMIDVVRDIGLQHLGGDRAVIGDREQLAQIVAERGDHLLVGGAGAARQSARHQAVGKLAGGKADLDRVEPRQALHDLPRRRRNLMLAMFGGDMGPLARGALFHVGEHAGSVPQAADAA